MKLKIEKINVKMKKNISITQKYEKDQKRKKYWNYRSWKRVWENPSLPNLPDTRSDSKLPTIPDPDLLYLLLALLWRLSFKIGNFAKDCLQPLVNRISIKILEKYWPSHTLSYSSKLNDLTRNKG